MTDPDFGSRFVPDAVVDTFDAAGGNDLADSDAVVDAFEAADGHDVVDSDNAFDGAAADYVDSDGDEDAVGADRTGTGTGIDADLRTDHVVIDHVGTDLGGAGTKLFDDEFDENEDDDEFDDDEDDLDDMDEVVKARLAEALAQIDATFGRPPSEQVAAFTNAHQALSATLNRIDAG